MQEDHAPCDVTPPISKRSFPMIFIWWLESPIPIEFKLVQEFDIFSEGFRLIALDAGFVSVMSVHHAHLFLWLHLVG